MQLTRATEYAIRGLVCLNDGKRGRDVRNLSERLDIPESFLAKIFASLAKAGIVVSQRGRHGGYRLAKKPDGVSLKRIIEATEGPLALTRCLGPFAACDRTPCGLKKIFALAQKRMEEVLENVTLADLKGRAASRKRKR